MGTRGSLSPLQRRAGSGRALARLRKFFVCPGRPSLHRSGDAGALAPARARQHLHLALAPDVEAWPRQLVRELAPSVIVEAGMLAVFDELQPTDSDDVGAIVEMTGRLLGEAPV